MKRASLAITALTLVLPGPACKGANRALPRPAASPAVQRVALAEVIAKARQYDGKRVRVVGFVHLEFEGDALYLQGPDYFHGVKKHAVWLEVARNQSFRSLNNSYVAVEARFQAEPDNIGRWAGTLRDITTMEAADGP